MRRVLGLAAAAATAGIGTHGVAQAAITVGHAYFFSENLSSGAKPYLQFTNTNGSTFGPVNITIQNGSGPHKFSNIGVTTPSGVQSKITTTAVFHPGTNFTKQLTANASITLTGAGFNPISGSTSSIKNIHLGWFHTGTSRPRAGHSMLHETLLFASGVDGSSSVPEPASIALISAGLIGLGAARRRRLRAA